MCDTNGKQLSGSRVNKGFPYMEYDTEPLFGQKEPPRKPKTQNHCVTLAGAAPPQPLCDTNGKQLSGPRVNKGFPLYGISHITTLWANTTSAYTQH